MNEHKNIAAALAAAQLQMGKAIKSAENPQFKKRYADLSSVMEACMDALNSNGIAVIQPMTESEFGRHVVTRFLHTSGEAVECAVPLIVGKQDMQGLGSAITYARRYGLMALAGIAPEDDDGNAAVVSVGKADHSAQSWSETIIAELPPDATPHDKAKAIADAIIAQWKRKKTEGEMVNEWNRREKLINGLQGRFDSLYASVIEAYEDRLRAVSSKDDAA